MGILDEQRSLCEDLERLEQACADRILEEPKSARERLTRDHQIAKFVDRFQQQSARLLETQADRDGTRQKEIDSLSSKDPFEEFYRQLGQIKDFHRRYPNEPVENLERAYKRRQATDGEYVSEIDTMFTGEEAHGKFFDLTKNHEDYLNLPGVKRITYLSYLSLFNKFDKFARNQKMNDKYFKYVSALAEYLESFLSRTRPLENPEGIVEQAGKDFEKAWEEDSVAGWGKLEKSDGDIGPRQEEVRVPKDEFYCEVCAKGFKNNNVFDHHFNGKQHKKAAAKQAEGGVENGETRRAGMSSGAASRLKDKAIAEREWRIVKLTEIMTKERDETMTNVERKQSLTERERQMELDALYEENSADPNIEAEAHTDDENDDEKIYNPLKLPLAWDGKPIPYWLYKLHGLGVEFSCEICGNFVYMGRRAFDKHFNEYRHTYGLRCLGITNTTLFREITKIDEAQRLWEKLENDKKKTKMANETVEEMEDGQGNVMPRKVYEDLQKQGLL
ncbi:hypothetical protein HOY80DRAFT_951854 [Tuber brumale]|nr:hypothetical protein HOY80DRAFT_951854 [Tuber brumale]